MSLKLFVLVALGVVLQQRLTEAAAANTANKKTVYCYWGTWAAYRQGNGKYEVNDIDPFLCTHIAYSFFGIQETGEIRYTDPYLDLEDGGGKGYIKKFSELKQKNPDMKLLAAFGGWNEGSEKFSIVANDPERRKKFVQSVIDLLLKFKLDGADCDWEYPNKRHSLKNDDKANLVTLLSEMKQAMNPHGFILAAAVPAAEDSVKPSYNVPEISKHLDLINIMAYDLKGPWDPTTGYNAPLYAGAKDTTAAQKQLNVQAGIEYWIKAGAPREKIILGVPFYGHTYKLANANDHGVGAPSSGPGIAGKYSQEAGTINYLEICELMQTEKWNTVWDDVQQVPYAYFNENWVTYENKKSIALKAAFARDHALGGVMVWSLEHEDARGVCGEKYPLLNTVNNELKKPADKIETKQADNGESKPAEKPAENAKKSWKQWIQNIFKG